MTDYLYQRTALLPKIDLVEPRSMIGKNTVQAMQIGAVAFLIKPFDDEQIVEAVHRALGHATDRSRLIKPGAHHRFSLTRDSPFAPSLGQRPDKRSSRNLPKILRKQKGTKL